MPAKAKRPLDYSTKVPVHQTVAECSAALAAAGASAVTTEYDHGEPCGLGFMLETPHGKRRFAMPVRVDGVAAMIERMMRENPPDVSGPKGRLLTREHAAAVAWRQVLHWLRAQLAIIEAGMAGLDEVMLAWLQIEVGGHELTLYEHYKNQESAALEAGR